ncbi:acyl-CoA thioesterase [Rhodococcus opacus]|uniref:acyl-CoA thioesterase n=1 Tax=Rhodococcus opacus TaxID=37919 RepID=UPI0039E8E0E3
MRRTSLSSRVVAPGSTNHHRKCHRPNAGGPSPDLGARRIPFRIGGPPVTSHQIEVQFPPRTATRSTLVEWFDTDAAGHHHNSSILRWVEACEVRLYRQLGLLEHFPSMPRVQQVVNYTSKLWFGQQVTTTVHINAVGQTSITFEFEVYGEEFDGAPRVRAAHGSFTSVHVRSTERRHPPGPTTNFVGAQSVINRWAPIFGHPA